MSMASGVCLLEYSTGCRAYEVAGWVGTHLKLKAHGGMVRGAGAPRCSLISSINHAL